MKFWTSLIIKIFSFSYVTPPLGKYRMGSSLRNLLQKKNKKNFMNIRKQFFFSWLKYYLRVIYQIFHVMMIHIEECDVIPASSKITVRKRKWLLVCNVTAWCKSGTGTPGPRSPVWKINIDILTFFLEYSRILDGRLKTLSCEIYHAEREYYYDKYSNTVLCYLGMPETCPIFLMS